MFSNILIYFVIIPLLMLGGFALCRNVKQIAPWQWPARLS